MTEKLDRALDRLGATALLVLSAEGEGPDLGWFTGAARLGDAFVLAPRGAPPRLAYFTPMEREEAASTGLRLLTPEQLGVARRAKESDGPAGFLAGVLEAGFAASGLEPGPIALAGRWPVGALVETCARLAERGWSFRSAGAALRRLRKRKSEGEIDEIRRVARATGEAFRAIARRLSAVEVRDRELWSEGERLTVRRLKSEVAVLLAGRGLSQPRECIVAPGGEGGVPHTTGTPDRVLHAEESLVVDLFPKGELFADVTRTFCVGTAPETLRRAHADVMAALRAARAAARPDVRGWDLQEATCRLLAERGWPTPVTDPGTERGYVHGLGHGVGRELHEDPSFKSEAGEEGLLEAGDVVTLEPGLYEPGDGGWGIRIEDLLVIRTDGVEDLCPLPVEMDPSAWAS